MSDTPETSAAPATGAVDTSNAGDDVTEVSIEGDDEAAYQAEMARIKAESPDEKSEDEDLSDEEKEYRAEIAKHKASEKAAKEKDAVTPKDEKPKEVKKEEKAPEKKIWKLKKLNGEEIEFDASDEKKVQQVVQKVFGAEEKLAASAKIEKQAKNFIQALKQNPFQVLAHPGLGHDKEQLLDQAAEFLYEHKVKFATMTPEQRAQAEKDAELERYRQEDQKRKATEKQQQDEQLRDRFRKNWEVKFTDALKTGSVPKTDWTLKRMADYMKVGLARGFKDIQPGDVVQYVKRDWIAAQREMFQYSDDAAILEMLGQENVDRVRRANLAKMGMGQQAPAPAAQTEDVEDAPTQPARRRPVYGSTDEFVRSFKKSA